MHEDYCDSGRSRATSARYSDTLLAARGLAMTRSVFSRSHFYSLTLSNIPIAGPLPKALRAHIIFNNAEAQSARAVPNGTSPTPPFVFLAGRPGSKLRAFE